MSGRPTEQFGNYELLRKIGQGGMSEVFLARVTNPPTTGEMPPIVVKRLHEELERNKEAVDLFLTEADVTLLLSHPNVVRVYDSGEVNGRYYMAMEYVHGKDLEQIFDRFCAKSTPMHPNVAVHIMAEVLKGLDYVHTAKTARGKDLGVVHRDVTPANIFISSAGHVKLGDFGVAKLVAVESWTMAGSVKGKLGYLSPEQVAAEPPSQSIDLWAAALILWELLAGERAFVGDNELDVMLRIKKAKVTKVRKVNKEVPKPIAKIVGRALHRKEKKRYLNAGEFLAALQDYMAGWSEPLTPDKLVAYLTQILA